MKQLIFLITTIVLAGCKSPNFVLHVTPTDIPIETRQKMPVEISGTVTIPSRDHTGETVVDWTQGDPVVAWWDWEDAITQVTIEPEPREGGAALKGPREASRIRINAKTTLKDKSVPVTLRDTIEIVIRDTVKVDCPPVVTPPPAGSPWWLYILYALVAAVVLYWGGFTRTRKK